MLRQLSGESGPERQWREETGPGSGLMFTGGNPVNVKTLLTLISFPEASSAGQEAGA